MHAASLELPANFDLTAYLQRIGFSGTAGADLATLQSLMRCQLFSVPFENLDVQAGKIVSLQPADIVDKIVNQRRGGYCYEVNGIFAMALQTLGFEFRMVACRPMFYPVRRPKTHMVLVVHIDGKRWLCDLGFGSYGIRAPLDLDQLDDDIVQDYDRFRLSMSSDREYLLQAWTDGQWVNQYGFDLYAQEWIDFAPANYLNSTHPDAVFVQKPLLVQHHSDGRTILFGNSLKQIRCGETEQRQFEAEEYPALLQQYFALQPV